MVLDRLNGMKTPDATRVEYDTDSDFRMVERSETKVEMFDDGMLDQMEEVRTERNVRASTTQGPVLKNLAN